MTPIPIVMFGAAGRMGRMILQLAAADTAGFSIAGAVDRPGGPEHGKPLSALISGYSGEIALSDAPPASPPAGAVAIHFMLPDATIEHLPWSERHGVPTVIGTTGLSPVQNEQIAQAALKVAVLPTANTSRGVNVLVWLAAEAARLLGPEYDVEIVEMHHRHKRDAPSGTAKRLAEAILAETGGDYAGDVAHGRAGDVGARPKGQLGMHALRGGDVIGDHTVVLAGPAERIELTHRARSRELFARGALDAARWLAGRPAGCYTMNAMLGL